MYRGKSIEITAQLNPAAAQTIAQWIGCATVIYNQKAADARADYRAWKEAGEIGERPVVDQQTAHIAKREGLDFLKQVPAQIKRNAASKFYQAMEAAKKGLRSAPRVKPRHRKRNCFVTNELFDTRRRDDTSCYVHLKHGAGKRQSGHYFASFMLPFPVQQAAKALYLSRQGKRFWLSMAYDNGIEPPTAREIAETLQGLPADELAPMVLGIDIGIAKLASASDGTIYHSDAAEIDRLAKLELRRKRHQRRYSRLARANDRTAGTNKRKRTKGEQRQARKLAAVATKVAGIRFNRSHHVSKAIAESAPAVAVFEDINLRNLTRRAKAKQCPDTGKWLRNGACAKSGLNRSILAMNLGQMRDHAAYKLAERGKLFVKVKAAYSSQECSRCHHIAKENRKTQAVFSCVACGHTENADVNAAAVIKYRGVTLILSGTLAKVRTAKKISVRKKQAHDLASLGSGGSVSRALPATADDAAQIRAPGDALGQNSAAGIPVIHGGE